MKVSKYLLLKLALLFFLFPTFLAAQEEKSKLNGPVVKGIVEQFVSMHYSQKPLDDEMSLKIFKLYLNRLDPAHYYFLQDDLAEFRKYESRVDDMLRRGNANLALDIFERFKTRLSERLAMMEEFMAEDFDFSVDASWALERADQPYPKTSEEARKIWRTKIKFDLLTLKLGDTSLKEGKERLMKRVRGLWKDFSQYENDDVVSMFLNSMAAAYDPHSSYLAAQDLKNFDISIKLSLEGIGAVLRWDDGYTVVNSIVPGGAAGARHVPHAALVRRAKAAVGVRGAEQDVDAGPEPVHAGPRVDDAVPGLAEGNGMVHAWVPRGVPAHGEAAGRDEHGVRDERPERGKVRGPLLLPVLPDHGPDDVRGRAEVPARGREAPPAEQVPARRLGVLDESDQGRPGHPGRRRPSRRQRELDQR